MCTCSIKDCLSFCCLNSTATFFFWRIAPQQQRSTDGISNECANEYANGLFKHVAQIMSKPSVHSHVDVGLKHRFKPWSSVECECRLWRKPTEEGSRQHVSCQGSSCFRMSLISHTGSFHLLFRQICWLSPFVSCNVCVCARGCECVMKFKRSGRKCRKCVEAGVTIKYSCLSEGWGWVMFLLGLLMNSQLVQQQLPEDGCVLLRPCP